MVAVCIAVAIIAADKDGVFSLYLTKPYTPETLAEFEQATYLIC
jgi:hypothetical protein